MLSKKLFDFFVYYNFGLVVSQKWRLRAESDRSAFGGPPSAPYTALQAVNLKFFLYLISGLHRKSGNPLLKPTPRRQAQFSHVSVLNSTRSIQLVSYDREYRANRLFQNLPESVLLTYICFSRNETSDIPGTIHHERNRNRIRNDRES
jgi:hypothetical protein